MNDNMHKIIDEALKGKIGEKAVVSVIAVDVKAESIKWLEKIGVKVRMHGTKKIRDSAFVVIRKYREDEFTVADCYIKEE
jgi:folate-dependent phosphoribosylglycinamide formyltransferase PurN